MSIPAISMRLLRTSHWAGLPTFIDHPDKDGKTLELTKAVPNARTQPWSSGYKGVHIYIYNHMSNFVGYQY